MTARQAVERVRQRIETPAQPITYVFAFGVLLAATGWLVNAGYQQIRQELSLLHRDRKDLYDQSAQRGEQVARIVAATELQVQHMEELNTRMDLVQHKLLDVSKEMTTATIKMLEYVQENEK